MNDPVRRPGRAGWTAALLVAAVYVVFLLFAEFALLALVERAVRPDAFRTVLGLLGAGGVAGSVAAAWRYAPERFVRSLAGGFAMSIAAAVTAPFVTGEWLGAVTLVTGLGLGWLTVTLVCGLPALTGPERLGRRIGWGTGLAYAICNLPPVFSAPAHIQAFGAVFAGVLGLALCLSLPVRLEAVAARPAPFAADGWWRVVAVFVLLIGLDSGAFYLIQHTDDLRAVTWQGDAVLAGNALVHLVAAVIAGYVLDARRIRALLPVAAAALLAACALLVAEGPAPLARLFYTSGVSLYSAALVYAAARGGRRRAAALFALAGWGGSALGIIAAQRLHGLPPWLLLASGAAFVLLLFGSGRGLWVGGALALALVAPARLRAQDDMIARGRAVYVSEGCVHCHSQYVRPGTADVVRWGPARPLAAALQAAPPLFGDRREGPDLANVGNRRSPDWNRLHLIDPRALTPGSRMPSYAHLFRPGAEERGDALLAYLASLGADTGEARAAEVGAWRPAATVAPSRAEAARTFGRLCAECHGAAGHGDGPLAARLEVAPPDFGRATWRRVTAAPPDRELAVARIIKFGVPGTPMAGREYLDDAAVISLARYVIDLHTQ